MKLLSVPAAAAAGLLLLSPALAAPAPAALPAPAPAPAPAPDAADAPTHHLEERLFSVTVDMPSGGKVKGRSLVGVETFNAIPYADPPVGPLRLKPPRRLSSDPGTVDGTGIAPGCPQMFVSSNERDRLGSLVTAVLDIPFLKPISGQEDCLTVNVQRPAGTRAGAKLPVLFWIYGGGFEFGATNTYDATSLLTTAALQKQQFIFVAVNYRVGGFGFMPGREVLRDGSANLGLLDQRMGLEWVADNIDAFGGDPDKVTIWGESAGAISVFDQMLLYGGNATYKSRALFRGAIMNSGSVVPADPVDCPKGQAVYDAVVAAAGCSGDSDTLECLRRLDYDTLLRAANSVPSIFSYNSVALSYLPRPDGTVLPDSPDRLGEEGRFFSVPFIIGDQEDEGTLFSVFQKNETTTDNVADYLSRLFFHNAPRDKLKEFVDMYEPGLTEGSPFRTSIFNELYPGFKRMAAILGDLTFTLTRRVALGIATSVRPETRAWSYLSSYAYGTPFLGTFHASDILQIFYGFPLNNAMKSCRTYYFNFVHNLDPNVGVGSYAKWPEWKDNRDLMWFKTPFANTILKDDFRGTAAKWIEQNKDILHI